MRKYYRSQKGGPWEEVEVHPHSLAAKALEYRRVGEPTADDGYGNIYKYEEEPDG
jgi:hypothetical protein